MKARLVGLILTLTLSIVLAPLHIAAQPGRVFRIGCLLVTARTPATAPLLDAFVQGLRDLGYVEGRNLAIEWRYAEGNAERLPGLAAELVQLKVDVIFAPTPASAGAAKQITGTVPIVFAVSADPVGEGLVTSLARPGGNATGLSSLNAELSAKRVELLKEAVPTVRRLAVLLMSPGNWAERPGTGPAVRSALKATEAGAKASAMQLQLVVSPAVRDLERAFATMSRQRAQALVVLSTPLALVHRREIADLAAKNRLPSVGDPKEFAEAGGLLAYGPNLMDRYRRAAAYIDKILKGADPSDLPVEQPTRYYLAINTKTAKALGLRMPRSLLMRADQVIE